MKLPVLLAALVVLASVMAMQGGTSLAKHVKASVVDCPAIPAAPAGWAFFDAFDNPSPICNRSGQLNGTVWGVSRLTGRQNISGQYNAWAPTTLQACSGLTAPVLPPHDVIVCNGQLREASNDFDSVTVLAMYPKQPFDFAGRTGTVVFDVGNDTNGTHGVWPEFWLTDKPVPAPFTHEESWQTLPQHGFGIRFAADNGACGAGKWTVDGALVVRNYVPDGDLGAGVNAPNSTLDVHTKANDASLDCVTFGSPTALNHIEIRVSQGAIDVWAGDAGSTVADHHIASIPNAALSLTRGLVWIEDAHYSHDHINHTFAWDNVGFDGPFTYHDLSFDVLDNTLMNGDGTRNLGWKVLSCTGCGEHLNVDTLPMTTQNIVDAASARLLFNADFQQGIPTSFTYLINGHSHTVSQLYSFTSPGTAQTYAYDVPLSDLVNGANHIELFSSGPAMIVMNVNIVLVNVGGAPSPTPTSSPSSTASPTATVTSTPIPTATETSSPTATPTTVPSSTSTTVPTSTSTPIPPTPTPTFDLHDCQETFDGWLTAHRIDCP